MSESGQNDVASSRLVHFGGHFHGRRLEASSFKSKSHSAGKSLPGKPSRKVVKFPALSAVHYRHTLQYPFRVEEFSTSKNYFGDVTRKCLADERFRSLRETLIPPENRETMALA